MQNEKGEAGMQTGASLAPRFPRESTGDSALTAGTREKQERVRAQGLLWLSRKKPAPRG